RIEPYNYRYDGRWPLSTAWNSLEGGSQAATFRIWRDASKRLATCTWAGDRQPVARADPAGDNALFVNTPNCCSLKPNSALLLMVPTADDGNPCRILAADDVGAADFSPDGTAMFWLVEPTGEKAVLWTAARDGSAVRQLGEGYIAGILDEL